MSNPNICSAVVAGGGGGAAAVATSLRHEAINLRSLTAMGDNGGSSEQIIQDDRYDLVDLPLGDLGNSYLAHAKDHAQRDYYSQRDHNGDSFSNLRMAELIQQLGSFTAGINAFSRELGVEGKATPITLEPHMLRLHDGPDVIDGEQAIEHHTTISDMPRLSLVAKNGGPVMISEEAEVALHQADVLFIAPGDPHCSPSAVLAAGGFAETVNELGIPVVMICNILNLPQHSNGWHVMNYIRLFEQYLGEGRITTALFNHLVPNHAFLRRHTSQGEELVRFDDAGFKGNTAELIGADLVSMTPVTHDPRDRVARSRIRHDEIALGAHLMDITQNIGSAALTKAA